MTTTRSTKKLLANEKQPPVETTPTKPKFKMVLKTPTLKNELNELDAKPLNYAALKDLIALQQATKISVSLQGSPNEQNNFLEFNKEFISTFDFLGLWDHESGLPSANCHAKLIIQNIPNTLRYIYESNQNSKDAITIYFDLYSAYMKGTALTKRQALTQFLQITPTNDQVRSLADLNQVIHKVEVALGNEGLIEIRELAELLYIARLPKAFESIVNTLK